MLGTLKVMDRTGHTEVLWDTQAVPGSDLDPKVAMAEFDRLVASGALAIAKEDTDDVRIRKFDPEKHSDVTVIPQFIGG